MPIVIALIVVAVGSVAFHLLNPWWLTPIASAKRTEEIPLSDCRMSQRPVSQTPSGSLVECNGVRVVTVNCKRHSRFEH